MFEVVARYVHC